MSPSSSSSLVTSTSTQLFQDFFGELHKRKLLQRDFLHQSTPTTSLPPLLGPAPSEASASDYNFSINFILVLSVLVCGVICSLGLNFVIICAVRRSRQVGSRSRQVGSYPSTQLANKGVEQRALQAFPVVKYSVEMKLSGSDSVCVICLSEFEAKERVRLLPKCNHIFHAQCIDKWLGSHSSCPTCRQNLDKTSQRTNGCSQARSSEPHPPVQQVHVVTSLEESERLMPGARVKSAPESSI